MKKLLFSHLLALVAIPVFARHYLQIDGKYCSVDGKNCYKVRDAYPWDNSAEWIPYCGKFNNLWFEDSVCKRYIVVVDTFDLNTDEMNVL